MTDAVTGETGDPSFPRGVMLRDVSPEICLALSKSLRASGDAELAAQMERVVVPVQGFPGTTEDFSFVAWPIPRLTKEERYNMELQEYRDI
ncbi:MAG TPA: hypothetical protein VGR70_20490, partial [Stellaceae bacterium]|nr:hypothetical protein [Stellaceae bacterium]